MIVHGYRAIEEYLKKGGQRAVLLLSRRGGRRDQLEALARSHHVPVRRVADEELDRLAGDRHRGAVLQVERPSAASRGDLQDFLGQAGEGNALFLFLDEITDPHNLGAILRSADQFRVDLVVVPAHGAAHETETVSRVSSGASAHVPLIVVPNLVRAMEQCRDAGFWIYGADASGESVEKVDLRGRVGIVLGSEGKGLRRLVGERCDRLISIPSVGHVDSFNVSVAAGILMYEVRRQQGFARGPADPGAKEPRGSGGAP